MARIPNIDDLTLPQLLKLKEDLASTIAERQSEEKAGLKAKMAALAKEAGVSIDELFGTGKRRVSQKRSSAGVAYRNPANPDETWTGRGRRPQWLVERLAKRGTKLEDFAA